MSQDKKTDPNAAPQSSSGAASFLPHLGNPPLSFIMPCKYMGWHTSGSEPIHRYLMACGHMYTSNRKRSQGSACFCPDCADAWAERSTEAETIADRLELTDAGFKVIAVSEACKEALGLDNTVTEDTCQIPLRGFPTNP